MKSDLITKFERGDPLTDNDCWWLLKFFTEMEEGCKALGPEYNLFQNQMRQNRMSIESYLDT